jgi:hypothetical protein
MMDLLRRVLHLGPDDEERQRTDEVIERVNRAVEDKARADQAFLKEVVCNHPDTALAHALVRAREGKEGHLAWEDLLGPPTAECREADR